MMNNHCFVFLNLMMLIVSCYSTTKPVFCKDCKFFMPTRNPLLFPDYNSWGKCGRNPRVIEYEYYLITGKKGKNEIDYHYCNTARKFDDLCGATGKYYIRK